MPAALLFATQVLGALPQLIQDGQEVAGLVTTANTALKAMQDEKRDPTPAEWDAVNAHLRELQGELHAPIGPSA